MDESRNSAESAERTSPVKAIRAFCIDCCGGAASEVKTCTAPKCALYPFRMGKNPYRAKRELTDEQREAIAERLAKARQNKGVY